MRRVHEMPFPELERRVRRSRLVLGVVCMVFPVVWMITWLYGYAVDPLVSWMCLASFSGYVVILWALAYLQEYFVWLLRLRER